MTIDSTQPRTKGILPPWRKNALRTRSGSTATLFLEFHFLSEFCLRSTQRLFHFMYLTLCRVLHLAVDLNSIRPLIIYHGLCCMSDLG